MPAGGSKIINMNNAFVALRQSLANTIVGQDALLDQLLIALLARGHVLIEGMPGLAKTRSVAALAEGLALKFQRIQFTPDLIPGDITGTDIYRPEQGTFEYIAGPIFNEIILADEINRAPPKVQSAMLEAMQEAQVTVGGRTRALPAIFMVIATQNPVDTEGTYPLPEAQLDRFLFRISLDYPTADEELEILHREAKRWRGQAPPAQPLVTSAMLDQARADVDGLYLDDMLARYIVAIVQATRQPKNWIENADWIEHGASPRATLAIARAARARAFLKQRDFVEPSDIAAVAQSALNHRIQLSFSARAQGITANQIINTLLSKIPVP